jgi:hypothetical protein
MQELSRKNVHAFFSLACLHAVTKHVHNGYDGVGASGWWLTVTFGRVLDVSCGKYKQSNQCTQGKCLLLEGNRHFLGRNVCMYASRLKSQSEREKRACTHGLAALGAIPGNGMSGSWSREGNHWHCLPNSIVCKSKSHFKILLRDFMEKRG